MPTVAYLDVQYRALIQCYRRRTALDAYERRFVDTVAELAIQQESLSRSQHSFLMRIAGRFEASFERWIPPDGRAEEESAQEGSQGDGR